MFFIQVVHGCRGGHLQFSGGGSKMAWLGDKLLFLIGMNATKIQFSDYLSVSHCVTLVQYFT